MANSPHLAIKILKRTLKIIGLTLIAIPIFYLIRYGYYTHQYDSLNLPISAGIAYEKMGKPDEILANETNKTWQQWKYYCYTLPADYNLVIKDGMVVDKYENILP